jgi:hypothetical protein
VAGALIGGFVGALWGEAEARQETGIEKNGGAENFDPDFDSSFCNILESFNLSLGFVTTSYVTS